MKTVLTPQYDRFYHRASSTRFEPRALVLDAAGVGMIGVALVEDTVAEEHFTRRDTFLVLDGRHDALGATIKHPVAVSRADAYVPAPAVTPAPPKPAKKT